MLVDYFSKIDTAARRPPRLQQIEQSTSRPLR